MYYENLLFILVFFLQVHLMYGQNNVWRFVELGISYDQSYLNAFSSEQAALDTIDLLIENVNCLYEPYLFQFVKRFTIKLNVNINNPHQMRKLTSGYWNYRADACTSPDMVHHITGINGLAGVLGQAGEGGVW